MHWLLLSAATAAAAVGREDNVLEIPVKINTTPDAGRRMGM
jgi:hypothetical protein